jgi:hypothetical protein
MLRLDFSRSSLPPHLRPLPQSYILYQNYPNPFNPTTKIAYSIPIRSEVKLSVYNILGQEVMMLVNEQQEAGGHEAIFDASNLASGVYICRLQAGAFAATRKLVMVR